MENKIKHFDRGFDVDYMLYDTAKWLGKQVSLPTREFVDIAEQLHLRQEDWNTFWKVIREVEKKVESNIEVYITETNTTVTEEQLSGLKMALGEPEEESNCCGADVSPHNSDDNTAICMECREGCGIVYVF